MCSSKRPPEPAPAPAQIAETDKGNANSPAAKKAKKQSGRSSLRINRATRVGGSGAGLNLPTG